MTVPEGHARYVVIEGVRPGGAKLTIKTETTPAGAFQVDRLPTTSNPKPPPGARLTLRIDAKNPGFGKIRLLFNGDDCSKPLPVQIPLDNDGTARSVQNAYLLSNRSLGKAKERLEQLRDSIIAMTGAMSFNAKWDDSLSERYKTVASVLNLPKANLQPGRVSPNPKQKTQLAEAVQTITNVVERMEKSLNLCAGGETPFLMRSDLEPDFAYFCGLIRDDRCWGIELEKFSFTHSDPLGRAATVLRERFLRTGARRENISSEKGQPRTVHETQPRAFGRLDNADVLVYLVCSLTPELIDPARVCESTRQAMHSGSKPDEENPAKSV